MDIVPALTGMRLGIQLAVDALAARDHVKLQSAIGDLSQRLADANLGALDMSEHLRKIESELREALTKLGAAENRLAERDNYVLEEIRPGAFVYGNVKDEQVGTPDHYVCQICFDRGTKSILQSDTDGTVLQCRVDLNHSIVLTNNVPRFAPHGQR